MQKESMVHSRLLGRWEWFLMIGFGLVFIVSVVLISLMGRGSGSDDLLIKSRTLKQAQHFYERHRDNDGLGGAYKPEIISTPVSYFDYYIQSGESIHSIAKKFGMDEVTLVSINDIKYASIVRSGIKLKIPNQDGILVKTDEKEGLDKIAEKYSIEKEELARINSLTEISSATEENRVFIPGVKFDSLTRSLLLGEYFRRPAYGRFTSMYGYRRDPWTGVSSFHQGVDIANAAGGSIYAAAPGTVVYTGWSWIYGNMIRIKHTGGYVTLYGHLDRVSVEPGTWVNSGAVIGRMGNTGRSTGTHLHYEVRQWGRTINPLRVTIF